MTWRELRTLVNSIDEDYLDSTVSVRTEDDEFFEVTGCGKEADNVMLDENEPYLDINLCLENDIGDDDYEDN